MRLVNRGTGDVLTVCGDPASVIDISHTKVSVNMTKLMLYCETVAQLQVKKRLSEQDQTMQSTEVAVRRALHFTPPPTPITDTEESVVAPCRSHVSTL